VAIGDSLYKSDRVPFMLSWAVGADGNPADIEAIRQRVDEVCFVTGAPARLRTEIEDAASYGEGWIHGTVGMDAQGRAVGAVEAVSPWEMFFDEAGANDLSEAEYVIRDRQLSPFDVARVVNGAQSVYEQNAVLRAMAAARVGRSSSENPKSNETRTSTETIQWREFWLHVPASLVADAIAGKPSAAAATAPTTATLEWVQVLVVMAGDELVAVQAEPGPLPYFRAEWDIERTRALPQGVYDIMGPTQEVMTGVVRAWLANLRRASEIILAGRRDKMRQDPEELGNGIRFIDLDPDTRDVREAIQQFVVDGNAAGLVNALEMLLEFADLESHIPRIQQGQQAQSDRTAFQLRARLVSSGKYLNEIVRRRDGCIRWTIGWVVYVMALSGEIPHESIVNVVPRGFSQFADLVSRLDGLLQMLGLGAQNPRIDAQLNHAEITRQIVQAEDLDAGKVLLTPAQVQARADAEAQSQERQLALANAQADVAVKQARAAKDNASAATIQGNLQLGRAKFIHDVEQSATAADGAAAPVSPKPKPAATGDATS
jgi:hypothetical protein